MSLLHTIVAFIIALGLLIVVHEYGHYIVARWFNVKVLRFSVGFGRPLMTWRRGADRTEWVIAAIPSTQVRIPLCASPPFSVIRSFYRLQPCFRDGEIRRHELMARGLPVHLDVRARALQQTGQPFRLGA